MSLDIPRIKALCFDVDGTLSDTDDQMVITFTRLFKPLEFLLANRDSLHAARRFVMWAEAPGNAALGLLDTAGLDDEFVSALGWWNHNHPRPMKHFLLMHGVRNMLANLHGRYPMAVVSAGEDTRTLAFLDMFELRPYFNVIVTALTVERTKPYPDPIVYAAKEMGVSASECLMIGDTIVDIRAGKAAGAQTVGVLCGFGEEQELREKGADEILQGTWQLGNMLKSNVIASERSSANEAISQ